MLGCIYNQASSQIELKQDSMKQEKSTTVDNSNKTVLARGCDPELSLKFAKVVPPLIGNAVYVPTTNDQDFVKQLKMKQWSVIYFAPGACRYDAARISFPGGNSETAGWTLEDYKTLIYKCQGDSIQIVETTKESESVEMLTKALEKGRVIYDKK